MLVQLAADSLVSDLFVRLLSANEGIQVVDEALVVDMPQPTVCLLSSLVHCLALEVLFVRGHAHLAHGVAIKTLVSSELTAVELALHLLLILCRIRSILDHQPRVILLKLLVAHHV